MNFDFDKTDEWLGKFFELYTKNYDNLSLKILVVCPPAVLIDYIDTELMEDGFSFLEKVAKQQNRKVDDFSVEEFNEIVFSSRIFKLGAQDCGFETNGAFTGDVSAKMLKDVGCEYVIVGHSERRRNYFESDETIAKKLKQVVDQKLTPILCVGENSECRASNDHQKFIEQQLQNCLDKNYAFKKLLIAYEPIWAIGTNNIASCEQIAQAIKLIKDFVANNFPNVENLVLLYGGSVNSKNSAEILQIENVDGLLVGGASLDANEFINIACS